MKKAFITGITGFVGSALALRLAREDTQVFGLARNPARFTGKNDGITVLKGDLADFNRVHLIVEQENAIDQNTVVYHCAAVLGAAHARKKEYNLINTDSTIKLFDLAVKLKAKKFLYISSISAVGPVGSIQNPMTEQTEAKPILYYSISKLLAENHLIQNSQLNRMPVIIVRPPNIYGPGMNKKSGAALIFKGCKNKVFAIIGRGKNYVNFAYIDNIVEGIICCTNSVDKGVEIFFISDSQPYIVDELLNAIKNAIGSNTFIIKFPYFLIFPLAFLVEKFGKLISRDIGFDRELVKGLATNAYLFSIEKAQNIGFKSPVKLSEGIKLTLEYLKKN
ncbi:MAG: NAD(P)-dependent oxidoreductase [Candidatus Heimdallarchaeota archaeon]|nr:NAD(P)-dependent oxidoreductase [Candidatus Heimdallarchaeota archaeon]